MALLTKRTYDIVKQVDPNAAVVATSVGTRLGAKNNKFYKWYGPFLDSLANYGWPIDAYAVHTYPHSLGTPVDRGILGEKFNRLLKQKGAQSKNPVWDTENNFGLKGPGPAKSRCRHRGCEGSQLDRDRLPLTHYDWVSPGCTCT